MIGVIANATIAVLGLDTLKSKAIIYGDAKP
jgi:hypothetical protein